MLEHHEDKEPGERTEELSRVELLRVAKSLHVSDADVMTRAELRAAIDKARRPEPRPRNQPVTWVSVARRLIASIVEQGLHLPDAAALIRGDTTLSAAPKAPPPVATVTLARIYAAQGHLARALGTLDEVLATDSDHDMAHQLREQLRKQLEDEHNRSASPPPSARAEEPAQRLEPPTPPSDPHPTDVAATAIPGEAAPALDDAAPAHVDAAAAHVDAPPAHVDAAPQSTNAALPDIEAPPSSVEAAPPSVDVAARPEAPPPERQPRAPELIILETDAAVAYVYWELPWPQTGSASDPHWIWVVAHTPTSSGCDREERRYPITNESGALRVEGLPKSAIVRAKLTRDAEPSSRPLAVASSVRGSSLESRFTPHSRANPKLLANRALSRVDTAGAAYW
jgi:hypothetical protein